MDKEQLINELKKLKEQKISQLALLNATHDEIMKCVVELNHLIEEAEKES